MTDKKDEALKLAQGYMDGTLMTDHLTGYERKRYVMEAIRKALAEQPAQQQACHSKTGESEAQSNLTPTGEAQAQQQEPTVEDNSQNWRGMDGTTAYWLIQRHADGWADIGKMMGEWLEANQTQPAQQQEPMVTKNKSGITLHVGWDDLPIGTKLYTSPPASKPWVGLTDDEQDGCVDIADEAHINKRLIFWSEHHYNAIEAKLREKNHG